MPDPVLLLIDLQRDYFPGGAFPLVGPEAAVKNAAALLDTWRLSNGRVVHVQHLGDEGFLVAGTEGAEIHPAVAPRPGEELVTKAMPNAFLGTGLADVLGDAASTSLVVAGMMTSMCVDATVRAASDLGYQVTVAGDACAAPDLEYAGERIGGAAVHAAFLAALASAYARVAPTRELVGRTSVDAPDDLEGLVEWAGRTIELDD